jgi:hypothetical protein
MLVTLVGCLDSNEKGENNIENPEEEIIDEDGDGFSIEDDCDDSNPAVHPDAIEICDNIDNNCDATIDENMLEWSWKENDISWTISEGVAQVVIDIDNKGWDVDDYIADGIADDRHTIRFNDLGLRESHEIDESMDGDIDMQVNYFYTASGQLLEEVFDRGADSIVEKKISYSYDEEGRILLIETDFDGDGVADSVENFGYDEQGRQVAREFDADLDGEADSGEYTVFNEAGQVSVKENRSEGLIDSMEEYTYDEEGNLLYVDKDSGDDADSEIDSRHFHTLSSDMLVIEIDEGMDDEIDLIITHKFNENGDLIATEHDFDLDGSGDSILSLLYNQGSLVESSSENILSGDGELITIESLENKRFTLERIIDLEYFEAIFQNSMEVTCAE